MGEIVEISQGDGQQNAVNGWGDTMGKIQYWCPEGVSGKNSQHPAERNVWKREDVPRVVAWCVEEEEEDIRPGLTRRRAEASKAEQPSSDAAVHGNDA
ncbi:hypothetical protein WH47_04669 [Habropoda laboriosa]|uniref:Uncharacterized protein n=1 Tax=Habropoda laboriosa TaxID=597456 RepID=A0A0L7R2L6_9HYME|nr:hypothetical protein WH47_04669 [Habropoda laboriosa]